MERRGLTLIELMAVVVLLSLAAALAAVRLDGLTDAARLRSTADQIGRHLQRARVRALSSGMPLLIRYGNDPVRIEVREPRSVAGRWAWSQPPMAFVIGGGRIEAVVTPDAELRGAWPAVRIDGRGRVETHVVLLRWRDRWAEVVSEPTRARYQRLAGPPRRRSFMDLVEERP